MKKEVIDNEKDGYTLANFLNEQIKNDRQGELDISSGYFNIRGYSLVSNSLHDLSKRIGFSFRLLLGKDAIKEDYNLKSFEQQVIDLSSEKSNDNEIITQSNYESSVEKELNSTELNKDSALVVNDLIEFLRHKMVQVKTSKKRFNHSKPNIIFT